MDRMTLAEKLDYTHRRLLSATDPEQEMAVWNEFLVPLGRGETFAEMVRYFTTRLDDVIGKLRQITAQNKPPGYLSRLEIPQIWNTLAWTLIERKLPEIGRDLLTALYEFQLNQQGDMRRRFYKGFSLQNLGWANYLLGDESAARKVVRLALIEEVFNTLEMDVANQLRIVSSNPAYLMLRQTLKCSTIELNNFVSFAREYARRYPERCAYPEDCQINYLRTLKNGVAINSVNELRHISNFNYVYFSMLLDILRRISTVETIEACLADIATYLFSTVDEFTICDEAFPSNSFSLMVRSRLSNDPAIASLGNYLAIEWRYWNRELKVEDLIGLAGKLKLTGITTLVLFICDSENSPNLFDSIKLKTTIQRLYHQEKINLIVLKQNDLLEIERRNTNLLALIKLRLDTLNFSQLEETDKRLPEARMEVPPMIEMRPQPLSAIINQNQMPPMSSYQTPPMMQNQMGQMPPPMMQNQMGQIPPPMMQNQMGQMPPPMMPQNQMGQMPPMMQNQMGQMPPMMQNQMGQMPPPMMPQNIGPRDGSNLSTSNKAPRLVIRSTSTAKLVDNVKVSSYKPMVIKPSFEIKPSFDKPSFSVKSSFESTSADKSIEVQILKPCTNCQNQTSLSCKVCQKAFCNVHIDVSSLKCQSCSNPEKKENESDNVDKLE